jgi:Xaa-Pro aminopeptidase
MTQRLDHVRAILAERNLNAVLVTLPANRFYLSGFTAADHGPDESAGVLLVDRCDATLLTGATNLPWAEAEAVGVSVAAAERPWEKTVGERLRRAGWSQVGFEDSALSVASWRGLTDAAGADLSLVPLGDALNQLRAVKEPAELDLLAAALRLTDEAFVAATASLTPGTTERELAWRIEREMRDRGADGPAFPTIVAAGPHGARPHHSASDRPIEAGEPIVIDMGAQVGGYAGDLTRTIWVGEPTPRLRGVYNVVASAQRAALDALRAGLTGKEADAAARDVIEAAGYGDQFTHGLGHGLGIRVHEAPSLGKTSTDVLQAGNVVTVEPGIYLPDWGGVRIEDVGVVETDGFRVLTAAPKTQLDAAPVPQQTMERRRSNS